MPITRIESGVAPAKNTYLIETSVNPSTILTLGTEDVVISAPKGKIRRILNMYLLAQGPVGAASGTHSFTLLSGDINILQGKSVFGSPLKWEYSRWDIADSAQKPDTDVAAQNALYNTHITSNYPLTVKYFNGTDVSQALYRYVYLSLLETPLI